MTQYRQRYYQKFKFTHNIFAILCIIRAINRCLSMCCLFSPSTAFVDLIFLYHLNRCLSMCCLFSSLSILQQNLHLKIRNFDNIMQPHCTLIYMIQSRQLHFFLNYLMQITKFDIYIYMLVYILYITYSYCISKMTFSAYK